MVLRQLKVLQVCPMFDQVLHYYWNCYGYTIFALQWTVRDCIFSSALNIHSGPLQPHGIQRERIHLDVIDNYSTDSTALSTASMWNLQVKMELMVEVSNETCFLHSGKALTATSSMVDHFFHLQCIQPVTWDHFCLRKDPFTRVLGNWFPSSSHCIPYLGQHPHEVIGHYS